MKSNSVILKTVLYTILGLVILILAVFTLLTFFFPKNMASFYYGIGFKNFSQDCYYREYKKTKSLNTLYNSLKINIECKNYSNIVSRYEELSSDGNYSKFLKEMNSDALEGKESILVKSSICNLNAYLSEKYVLSLIKLNKSEKVKEYAISEFKSSITQLEFDNLGSYLLSIFADNNYIEKYIDVFDAELELNKTTFDYMVDYFDELNNYFINNVYSSNKANALKIYYGNRIIQVGLDLLKLNQYSSKYAVNSDQVNAKIIEIKNNYIFSLLGEE